MDIEKKFIKYIHENNLIKKNDKIVLAISGGPDSVALFYLLKSIKTEYNLTITLAHINHLLRGENADADEKFVQELGKKENIEVFIKREDIKKVSEKEKIGEEEAGRKVRYSFFEEVKKITGASKVALAHNLDDNVETFLFRIMRGSSMEGLASIPITRDFYIRPLLETYKKDILKYLHVNNFEYRIDESNEQNIYTRNKIRLDLIPYIEKEFNSNFKENINNLIGEVKEINNLLSIKIKELIIKDSIELKEIEDFSEYLKKKLLNEKLKQLGLNINRNKLEELVSILKPNGTKEINLGQDYYFIKKYDKFSIIKKELSDSSDQSNEIIKIGESIIFNGYQISIKFQYLLEESTKKTDNAYLIDYNKVVGDEFLIRTREAGDSFIPMGMNSKKKLKDFFINEKIDKYRRNILPIIINNDKIVCIGNIRMSEEFKVTEKTKKLIKIELKEVENCG